GSVEGRDNASRIARAPSGVLVRSSSAKRLLSGEPSEDSKSSSVATAEASSAIRASKESAEGPHTCESPGRIVRAYARAQAAARRRAWGWRGGGAGLAAAASLRHACPRRETAAERPRGGSASSGSRISRGRKSASRSDRRPDATSPARKRPVETSRKAMPVLP